MQPRTLLHTAALLVAVAASGAAAAHHSYARFDRCRLFTVVGEVEQVVQDVDGGCREPERDERQDKERLKAVELAVGQIEKQFGKGSIMRLGQDSPPVEIATVPTGSLGLDIALGCDIRVAAASAKLNPGFAKRGILPESGGTWLLPRIVGYAKAAEIAFTGRLLTADEALELGLVNHVVPNDEFQEAVRTLAGEITSNAPLAVRAIKRMMRAAETETFDQNVHHVFLQLLPLMRTADFKEGVAAYIEKRSPKFQGR